MSEHLESWNEDAPEHFHVAKAAYAELGPDTTQLERMLERVEQAAVPPAPVSRLGFGAKAWHWLLPVLTVVGATLWIVASRPVPATVASMPAPARGAPALEAPPLAVAPATPPGDTSGASGSAREQPATRARAAREARPPDPLAELALLDRARRVLAKDPQRAFALAADHQRHYAAGQFAEERELLAIEALMRLDRADAAQRRARQFRRAHPNSVHAHRLGVILSSEAP